MNKKLSIFKMLSNFKKELVEYARQGAPSVTENKYKDRLLTCNKCPHLKNAYRCGLCGCVVEEKAKWATAECPDNRWEKNEGKSNHTKTSK